MGPLGLGFLTHTILIQEGLEAGLSPRVASGAAEAQNGGMFQPGQRVRVNLAGMQVGKVFFQAAVTDAVGTIVKQTSEDPPKFLVKLLFSFKGVDEVEVPEERIKAA